MVGKKKLIMHFLLYYRICNITEDLDDVEETRFIVLKEFTFHQMHLFKSFLIKKNTVNAGE